MTKRWSRIIFGPILLLFLYAQPGFSQPTIRVDGAPFKGDKNARVTLIEFADYQCTFCARHFRETLPQIEKNYIETGKVKYVFRSFPLEHSHPHAFKAAVAAECAGEQGRYWLMHDRLFTYQEALDVQDLRRHAQVLEGLGLLDLSKFERCLDSEQAAAKVRKDLADGQKAGVKTTPTFFLGLTDPNSSQIKAVTELVGAKSYATFKEALDRLLGGQK